MTAGKCAVCGAATVVVAGADGKPVELDASTPVYLREIDREPAKPVTFWVQVGADFARVEHRHVCRGVVK